MATLDDAIALHARINNLTEQYALQIKRNQPAAHLLQNLKRQVPTLASKLKGQFGAISDLVISVNMAMSRGSSEQMRVRGLREGVAAIKVQLDIALTQTIAKHEIVDEKHAKPHSSD